MVKEMDAAISAVAISAAAAELEEHMETRGIRNKVSYLRYMADQKRLKVNAARQRYDTAMVELEAVMKLLGESVGEIK